MTAELADGTPVEGFGYRGGEWTLPQDATGVNLKNIPEGWNVNCVNEPTGSLPTEKYWLYNVSSPDGKISVTYRFTIPHIYTVDELAGVTATADGNPVEGFTPTQTGTWTVPHGSTVLLTGIPEGWVTTHEDNTLVWTVTAPDNSVSVTWTFEQEQPASSTDDLKGVTATVDGIPVDNFDPTQSGTWLVPSGSTVSLSGIPSDWQVTHEKGHSCMDPDLAGRLPQRHMDVRGGAASTVEGRSEDRGRHRERHPGRGLRPGERRHIPPSRQAPPAWTSMASPKDGTPHPCRTGWASP